MKTFISNNPVRLTLPLITVVLLLCFNFSSAQPDLPSRSNSLIATQPIYFGSFCITGGNGGTVTIDADGIRSAIGDITLLNVPPFAQPAIFEMKLCPSHTVFFNFETPYIMLTGSSGSIALTIGPTDKGPDNSCFTTNPNCNIATFLRVGGTLTVTGSSPPGLYSGYFAIRFTLQ